MGRLTTSARMDAAAKDGWGDAGLAILSWARKEWADEAWAYYHEIEGQVIFQKRIKIWKIPTVKVTVMGHDLKFLFLALFGPE